MTPPPPGPRSQPVAEALTVAGVVPVSARPETGKSAKLAPAARVTEAGTPTFEESELERVTVSGDAVAASKTTRQQRRSPRPPTGPKASWVRAGAWPTSAGPTAGLQTQANHA